MYVCFTQESVLRFMDELLLTRLPSIQSFILNLREKGHSLVCLFWDQIRILVQRVQRAHSLSVLEQRM